MRQCFRFLLTLALFVGAVAPAVAAKTFVLVEQGRPVATIVTAASASTNARAAALELQRYVRKMSGAELPLSTDEQRFQRRISINSLFKYPTIGSLAGFLAHGDQRDEGRHAVERSAQAQKSALGRIARPRRGAS